MPYKVGFIFDVDNDWIYSHLHGLNWLPDYHGCFEFIESFELEEVAGVDLLFILGYTKILPDQFLRSNGLNLVVHESELPLGKGFSPVQWQVIAGMDEIPVSLIEAVDPVDSGDIYGMTKIKLTGDELMPEIRLAQAEASKELIVSFLNEFPSVSKRSQAGESTYFRRRCREDDRLNPDKTIREQFNQLRVADNDMYPAYFEINGVRYILQIRKA